MMFNNDLKTGGGPGSEAFVKIKGGESVAGALRGEEYVFYTHWDDKGSVLCRRSMGISEHCEYCSRGDRPKARFRFNMVVKNAQTGLYEMKILEGSAQMYQELKMLHAEWDLQKRVIKIVRTGNGRLDTRYTVGVTQQEVTEEMNAQFSALDLHDLRHQDELAALSGEGSAAPAPGNRNDDDVPF
jgi:hypothetical protein